MMVVAHSIAMTRRHLMALLRQPWLIAMTLAQPVVWLLLFGALFQSVADIPGFSSDSYIDYLTPGIAIMSAILSGGWLGVGLIEDIKRGVLDRFLAAPTSRAALNVGRLAQQGLITLIQSCIIIGLGFALGARFSGGAVGIAVLAVCAVLLAVSIGAVSVALGLITRKDESLIVATNLMLLPLSFMSPIFMQADLMPRWMQVAATLNPVSWAVVAGREALGSGGSVDWIIVTTRFGLLVVLAFACTSLATWAFRSYQRSL